MRAMDKTICMTALTNTQVTFIQRKWGVAIYLTHTSQTERIELIVRLWFIYGVSP